MYIATHLCLWITGSIEIASRKAMSFYRSDVPPSLCDSSCEAGTPGPHKGFLLWSVAFTQLLFTGDHSYHLILFERFVAFDKTFATHQNAFFDCFLDRNKWVEYNCINIVRSRSVIWLGRVLRGMHEGDEKYRRNIRKPEGRTWLGGRRRRLKVNINPYPTAFPYGNGTVLHFYQQQESSTTKTVHKVINKGLKAYV